MTGETAVWWPADAAPGAVRWAWFSDALDARAFAAQVVDARVSTPGMRAGTECIRCGGPFDPYLPVVTFIADGPVTLLPTELRMCVNCGSNHRNVIRREEYERIRARM